MYDVVATASPLANKTQRRSSSVVFQRPRDVQRGRLVRPPTRSTRIQTTHSRPFRCRDETRCPERHGGLPMRVDAVGVVGSVVIVVDPPGFFQGCPAHMKLYRGILQYKRRQPIMVMGSRDSAYLERVRAESSIGNGEGGRIACISTVLKHMQYVCGNTVTVSLQIHSRYIYIGSTVGSCQP